MSEEMDEVGNIAGRDWRVHKLAPFAAVLVPGVSPGAPRVDGDERGICEAIDAAGEPVDVRAFLRWLSDAPSAPDDASWCPVEVCGARVNAAMVVDALVLAWGHYGLTKTLRLATVKARPAPASRAFVDGDMTALVLIADGWRLLLAPIQHNLAPDDPDPVWPEPHDVGVLS